jgi:hypothetical protein
MSSSAKITERASETSRRPLTVSPMRIRQPLRRAMILNVRRKRLLEFFDISFALCDR